jgi:D-alanyl-D-alanine carboxypeptidase/D-alanyl-D-alanine-endopeptidase (penicillin-binding protein 4)
MVADAETGDVLFSLNASQYFTPASNTKLFTTILALATLGPDHRIRTTVETGGTIDATGSLRGDLVLVGRGDGNLSNRIFPWTKQDRRDGPIEKALADLADQVVRRGVKEIQGDVVADDSYLAPGRFPSGWTVDDTVWSYGAAVSAIAVNDNVITLDVRPGEAVGAPLRFGLEPAATIYKVRNEATTTAAGTLEELRLARDPESRTFVLSGTVPRDAPRRQLLVAVQEPAENAAVLFASLLEARGVRITGQRRVWHAGEPGVAATASDPRRVLAEHVSPPLIEDVRLTNKISDNLHAELMLRLAAKEKGGAAILDDALKFAEQFRVGIGIAPEEVVLKDGSGLSRDNLATPQSFVKLLEYAARQPWGADFVKTLPIAGEDGTLENRMKGTAAAGRIQAKTGQVDHVENLSGFATTLHGERLIFSIMGDDHNSTGHDAAAIVDKIGVAMVEELGTTVASSVKSSEQQ